MKRLFTLLTLSCCLHSAQAQLADGTIAPNFTAVDINGNSYSLYTLLDQGKTVYLDIFATWCGPCWSYHHSGALSTIWQEYGPSGTGEAFVMAIEGDGSTNVNCIYGSAGCVGGTQGNWTTGTLYPIINNASIAAQYQINYFPTVYCICPADRKVYECGQLNATQLWNFRNANCIPPSVATDVVSVQPVRCYGSNTGAVNISVSEGTPPYTYHWSNNATTQDLVNVAAGIYTCMVTSSEGFQGITDPIEVEGPSAALTLSLVGTTPAGCSGGLGAITVEANGGWDTDYVYQWQNGQQGETADNLAAGTYQVVVTDDNGCTKSLSTTLTPPVPPTASIAPPGLVTCAQPTIQLHASASSPSEDLEYHWLASGGGNLVSGVNTLNPTVNAAGIYTLRVTDLATNCIAQSVVPVSANLVSPSAGAGTSTAISCAQPLVVLQGSGSAGSGISYLWSAGSGGNIVSGANTLTPTVNAAGTYTLQVSNSANGCTQTASVAVAGNNVPPTAQATGGTLTCATTAVTLNAATNAPSPVFAWNGPNGYTSAAANPVVATAGTYQLTILDPASGCSSTTAATVQLDNTVPLAVVSTPGNLNCQHAQLQLNATASSQGGNFSYGWTAANGGQLLSGTNTLTPLINAAGLYNLVVSNTTNGCSATTAVVVNQSPPVVATVLTQNNATCYGAANGNATAGASGGYGALSYAWSNGASSETISNLAAGSYIVTVIDGEQCTATATVLVTQPDLLVAQHTATAQSANEVNDGSVAASPAGGSGDYSYLWNNGSTLPALTGLAPGSYTVTVTDANACTAVETATVNSFNCALTASLASTNVSCHGAANGTAAVTLAGANEPVTYLWSNGADTPTLANLVPGEYTVSLTDAAHCPATLTVLISEPPLLLANATVIHETAAAAQDGAVLANPVGGTAGYTFAWSNGATTPEITGLAPGSYALVVTDANGCSAAQTVVVNAFDCTLALALTGNNIACPGQADGLATALPTGGSAPFTYVWSHGANTPDATNLVAGTYTVSVQDANGCAQSASITLTDLDDSPPTLSVQDATLALDSDGIAEATVALLAVLAADNCTVGEIVINPAEFDCDQLGVHQVSVTVRDGAGNVTTATALVTVVDDLAPVLTCPSSFTRCASDNLVSYELPVAVDNCLSATSSLELAAGLPSETVFPLGVTTQTFTYTDAGGNAGACSFDVIVVPLPEVLVADLISDVNGQQVGAIDITVAGIAPPYQFEWQTAGQPFANTEDLVNVGAGFYTVQVTDANGCTVALEQIEVGNTTVGAIEPAWLRALQLRPNPTSGKVRIDLAGSLSETLDLIVADASGRIVLTALATPNDLIELDCSALPDGLYWVQFRTGQSFGVRKLMVSHAD